jgi:hypothetical protein
MEKKYFLNSPKYVKPSFRGRILLSEAQPKDTLVNPPPPKSETNANFKHLREHARSMCDVKNFYN